MAGAGLHLLSVTVRPCNRINAVCNDLPSCIREAAKQQPTGAVIHIFKVVGENKVISVLNGKVEDVVSQLNDKHGEFIDTTCIPLRTYEGFAEHCLKVDKSLTTPSTHQLTHGGRLYWLIADVDYKGVKYDELVNVWNHEATFVMTTRLAGTFDIDIYKAVTQRQVHLFIGAPDEETADDAIFAVPMMKESDQLSFTAKSILAV